MGKSKDTEVLNSFSPKIKPFVESLIIQGKGTVCSGNMHVFDAHNSCPTVVQEAQCDRFKLVIPYAGQSLTWEILFDNTFPDEPPDFIFGPDDEDFLPNLENITSLTKWDPSNSSSLSMAVHELLREFQVYNRRLVETSSRLKFEFSSLLEQTNLTPEDIEIYVTRSEGRMGCVKFLIKLPVDFSQIPAYLTKDNPGEDSAVLLLTFQSPEGMRVTPQLFLSPRVENALGGSCSLRIPAFPSGARLLDYVPNVFELLRRKVDLLVQSHEKKKDYVAAFLSMFGRSVLEYDMEAFSTISFLFEWHDFYFIINIELPMYFPKEQPQFMFQSVYHESKGKPYMQVFEDYPYSPRWSGIEMAERARSFILDTIGQFQKSSVLSGSL
ncbi:BRISC and BRCA1-A complex member 2-like [Gigantopelta aegis]|uniref:BRISC and BRCA1-A complex member 2-like n=1 Tax=Gigantopelta aegis TaxID=1735272 RepID=UPI001B88E536|nr:BRISC and BRCA1-A complex member 2-like [Gigantopelta aegis]